MSREGLDDVPSQPLKTTLIRFKPPQGGAVPPLGGNHAIPSTHSSKNGIFLVPTDPVCGFSFGRYTPTTAHYGTISELIRSTAVSESRESAQIDDFATHGDVL